MPDDGQEVTDNQMSKENAIVYQRVMELISNKFSEKHVQIFIQSMVHQRSAQEVAEEFGTTPNVVYQVRSRILNYIRTQFLDLLG